MADPPSSPKSNAPFFVVSLASHNSNPLIPEAFFAANNKLTSLKLTSDACDRTWQVKLNGRRFTEGWEDFSNAHCLRDDDVLLFRDVGQMIFHVTPSGRSFSQIHYISSSADNIEADEIDDDTDDGSEDEDGDSEDDEGGSKFEDGSHSVSSQASETAVADEGTTRGKKPVEGKELSEFQTMWNFKKQDLAMKEKLLKMKILNQGDEIETEDCPDTAQMNQNRTVAIDFKPDMLRSGQLVSSNTFCFKANGIKKVGDSFTLDVVRGGTSPVLKICSKEKEASVDGNQTTSRRQSRMIQASRAEEEMETRVQKKARVSGEGGSSRRKQIKCWSSKLAAHEST
ncbi:unnamed protein product [Brassica rapa subsp. trilocularis]